MRNGLLLGVLLLAGAVVFWASTPQQTDGQNMEEQIVTPNSDLAGLAKITAIAGEPTVLWARLPVGRIDQTGRVPGPTDLILIAVLDYGTAAAAEAVLTGKAGTQADIDVAEEWVRYNWFPKPVLDTVADGKLAVVEYGMIDAFGGARVSSVRDAPHILLISKMLL